MIKKKNIFVMENILSETIFRFSSCSLFSNINRKITFMAQNGSDLCNFYYSYLDYTIVL